MEEHIELVPRLIRHTKEPCLCEMYWILFLFSHLSNQPRRVKQALDAGLGALVRCRRLIIGACFQYNTTLYREWNSVESLNLALKPSNPGEVE